MPAAAFPVAEKLMMPQIFQPLVSLTSFFIDVPPLFTAGV
jgi:hypothetical protein